MTWLRPILGALLLLAGVAQAASAQTTADAKADGKAFGGSVIDRAKGAATTAPDASRVPGFNPAATQSLEDLADHPDRIEIGRAACRERVCQYVEISGVAGSLK